MPHIAIPFDQIDKPIDPAQYLAEVFSANVKPDKNGSTMIVWTFVIIEEGPFKGRKLDYWTGLNDQKDEETQRKSRYYLREFLKNIGAPYADDGFDLEAAYNCKAVIEVKADTYNGNPTSKIDKVLPVPDAA